MSRLGSFLVQEGILTPSDRQMIQRESSVSHGSFARSILALGLLDEDELSALFASKTVFRQASKDILQEMDLGVISIAPLHILAWLEVLPLAAREGALTVAMVDPTDQDAINQMAFFTGLRIKPVIATQSEILRGLREIGATIDVGESRFETFLKTHGRMSKTNQGQRAAPKKRRQSTEEDFDIPDMTFEDDHFEPSKAPTKRGATSSGDVLMGSDEPVIEAAPDMDMAVPVNAPAVTAVPVEEPVPAGADLSDPGLAASAPDEPVSAVSMELDMDLPPELEDDAPAETDEPDQMAAAQAPAAAPASTVKQASAKPAAVSLGGDDDDIDLSSLEADLDFDLDDSLDQADRPKIAAPAIKTTTPAVAASPAQVQAAAVPADDLDVDLSVDLSGGLGSLGGSGELPGGLDDEIKIQPEFDAIDDPNADLLTGMEIDDDSGPSLDGASDRLTLDSDELSLDGLPQDNALSLDDLALPAAGDELTAPVDDLAMSTPADDLSLDVTADSLAAPADDLSLDVTADSLAAPADDLNIAGDALDLEIGEPNLDLGTLESDVAIEATPEIGDLGDLGEIAEPSSDVVAAAAAAPEFTAEATTESGELSGAAHAGIAVLNRALVQVQMAADAGKALARVAEVAGKVGIDSGSVVTLKAGKLIPGIMWHKSGGKLGHIPDIPAGLDAATIQSFAANAGSGDGWVSIDQALGASGAAVKNAWPEAAQAPNMALVRTQGDAIILSIASFTGASDHDGLRQSFGDVIRAAGPKLGGGK